VTFYFFAAPVVLQPAADVQGNLLLQDCPLIIRGHMRACFNWASTFCEAEPDQALHDHYRAQTS